MNRFYVQNEGQLNAIIMVLILYFCFVLKFVGDLCIIIRVHNCKSIHNIIHDLHT